MSMQSGRLNQPQSFDQHNLATLIVFTGPFLRNLGGVPQIVSGRFYALGLYLNDIILNKTISLQDDVCRKLQLCKMKVFNKYSDIGACQTD